MEITDSRLYELYKPLKNHLAKSSVANVFYVIWAYINFFQFNRPIPGDIQVDQSLYTTKDLPNRALREWELALLAREIVLYGEENPAFATVDFRIWNHFTGAVNKLKEFENNAWPIFGDERNVLDELRRIAHRQFQWQSRLSSATLVRYFKIYNNPRIEPIVKDVLKMNIRQWYTIGTALSGALLNHPKFNVDAGIQIADITKKEFDEFLKLTSIEFSEFKKVVEDSIHFDDEFVYTLNPLEYYPLVKIGPYYYAPVLNYLILRLTSGVYFDLIQDKRFGHPFGLAFQDYLVEVSEKVLQKTATVLKEAKYKVAKNEKDSVDLIVLQGDAAIFVEAKAKRMQTKAKSQLLLNQAMNKDLNLLAEDIVQVYKTIEDYRKNLYPHLAYEDSRKIYPLIVTLEEWYLIGQDLERLREVVAQKIQDVGISPDVLTEMPYSICAVKSYEHLLQVIKAHPIQDLMSAWLVPEKKGHDFGHFLFEHYGNLYKNTDDVFPGEFKRMFTTPI